MNTEHERQTPSSVENRWFLLPELAAADVAGFLAKVQDKTVEELTEELRGEIDRLTLDANEPNLTKDEKDSILDQISSLQKSLDVYDVFHQE